MYNVLFSLRTSLLWCFLADVLGEQAAAGVRKTRPPPHVRRLLRADDCLDPAGKRQAGEDEDEEAH